MSWCGKQDKTGKSEIVHWISDRNIMNTSVLMSDPWCTHTACDTYCWLQWYSSWLEEMLSYSLLALQRVSSRICIISRIQSCPYHDLKSTKLWNHHLVSLMSEQLSAIQSQPGVCMNMEKRDRRAAETERIIFHTKLKNKQKKLKILNCMPSFLVFHCM